MDDSVDLLVVGAGPAGSNAAAVALRAGLSVAQLDARPFPRVKPCAGGMTVRACRSLQLELAGSVRASTRAFEYNLWQGHSTRYTSRRRLLTMVLRPELDHSLVRQNLARGLRFHDDEPLRELHWDAARERFKARTARRTIEAAQVVAADGANGRINRDFAVMRSAGRAAAVEIVLPRSQASIAVEPATRFDFGALPEGYGWVFPKDDHWSIGLYTLRRGMRDLRERLVAYVHELGFEVEGDPLASFEAHTIPVGGTIARLPREPLYVVGDAAALADALTGEGIFHALESGRLAGETAVDVAAGRAKPARYYRRLRWRVLSDTALTWHLARWFYRDLERGVRPLQWQPVWRAFVHGYGRGATFTECVLRGVGYGLRSWLRGEEHKERRAWRAGAGD